MDGQEASTHETAFEISQEIDRSPEEINEAIGEVITRDFENHELPQAVFILSGGIVPNKSADKQSNPEDNQFRSTSYKDTDPHGYIAGGKARVVAGAEIAKRFQDPVIVATSRFEPDQPTHALVQQTELLQRGVDKERILLEEESNNTLTELTELVKLANSKDWKQIVAITSDYHTPRCNEMWNRLEDLLKNKDPEIQENLERFKEGGRRLALVSAEEVLSLIDSKYSRLFEEVRKTPAYQSRLAAESKGLHDLINNTYQQ